MWTEVKAENAVGGRTGARAPTDARAARRLWFLAVAAGLWLVAALPGAPLVLIAAFSFRAGHAGAICFGDVVADAEAVRGGASRRRRYLRLLGHLGRDGVVVAACGHRARLPDRLFPGLPRRHARAGSS